MSDIYPIYLPDYVAEQLVEKHAMDEFRENAKFHSVRYQYEFNGHVLENGDVKLYVRYSFDDGFCMGAGGLFNKTIRPYTEDQLTKLKQSKMIGIAADVYEAQQKQKRDLEIRAIAENMFKGEFK